MRWGKWQTWGDKHDQHIRQTSIWIEVTYKHEITNIQALTSPHINVCPTLPCMSIPVQVIIENLDLHSKSNDTDKDSDAAMNNDNNNTDL